MIHQETDNFFQVHSQFQVALAFFILQVSSPLLLPDFSVMFAAKSSKYPNMGAFSFYLSNLIFLMNFKKQFEAVQILYYLMLSLHVF